MLAIKRLIPNLLTAGNLVGGILAIILTLTGNIEWAPYCIFASAIFDFLDGFVARLLNVQSEMGKQLDSLADMVTFGVAPGIMMYLMLSSSKLVNSQIIPIKNGSKLGDFWTFTYRDFNFGLSPFNGSVSTIENYLPFVALIIPVFALFRLAKFNLDTRQTNSFIGLPTPAMTLFFAVMPILVIEGLNSDILWQSKAATYVFMYPMVLIPAILIMSILMVSEIPLFSLKFKHFKFRGNEIRFIFLTICIILLATLFLWAIPLIIILYIILSLINNAIKPKHEV
ncbi:MAG: phosphatidylcholine/phosphatidylserine synthase [Crocinitomicaceae bacterium]